jgi:rubrerythrin
MSASPDSVGEKLLEILEEAIEREQLSQQRYALGASLAADAEVKEMFLRLIEDEMSHERILRERLVALKGREGS